MWSLRNVSATIITTLGRSIFYPLLLSFSTKFINNDDGDSRTVRAPRQGCLRRNFKNSEDFSIVVRTHLACKVFCGDLRFWRRGLIRGRYSMFSGRCNTLVPVGVDSRLPSLYLTSSSPS